ncbi:hypothetical protein Vadar_018790 [Vaccinium darrowii]|uniref:Uncharacterized protein n=1 Tax=Vaccinium darrowii TaxID=229202 RepID=A0ACB7Y0I7_9ERIC|nr:hypothetical protein Vadar_018790 [Vaccinium darrowii]
MGDTAVDFFLETLKQLITSSKFRLIIQEKHQLQSLEDEIKYLRVFLKDTVKKRNDHSEVMKLVMQIRDLVAEAENVVEQFVVHAFKADHAPYSPRERQDHLPIKQKKKQIAINSSKLPDHWDHASYSLCEHQDHLSLDLEASKRG